MLVGEPEGALWLSFADGARPQEVEIKQSRDAAGKIKISH
jgi:hypothetical protein